MWSLNLDCEQSCGVRGFGERVSAAFRVCDALFLPLLNTIDEERKCV